MKKIFTLLFSYCALMTHAQTPYFQKLYGDIVVDDVQSITTTADSGYALVGGSGANALDSTDITVYRVNRFGDMQWARKFGDPKDDFANDIKETADRGFIIVGTSYSSPTDTAASDMFIMKIDDAGFVSWYTYIGGSDNDEGNSVVITDDGGYIIFGSTMSFGSVLKSAFAVKIDANGFQQWAKIYSLTTANYFYRAHKNSDGTIIAVGGTYNLAGGTNFDHYAVKMDQNGQVVGGRRFGTTGSDLLYDYTEVNNGYILAGVSTVNTAGDADLVIFKTDVIGNIIWSYNYGTVNYDRPSSITTDAQGNIIVAGFSNVGNSTVTINQMTFLKLDSMGNPLTSTSYGDGSSNCECRYMVPGGDGGYALAGTALNLTDPLGDAYFVKVDDGGNSGCYQSPITFIKNTTTLADSLGTLSTMVSATEFNSIPASDFYNNQFSQICFTDNITSANAARFIQLFPNPAAGQITIEQQGTARLHIRILDMTGKNVRSEISSDEKTTLNISDLPAGVYQVFIQGENYSVCKKLVVQ